MFTRPFWCCALLFATLIATSASLTMSRSADDVLTLALHFPVFALASALAAHLIPNKWRVGLALFAAPAIIVEIVIINLS